MQLGPCDRGAHLAALAALMLWRASSRAAAHPHVWIIFETTVLYDKGTFVGRPAQVDVRRVLHRHGDRGAR